jgi:hypothetical protein
MATTMLILAILVLAFVSDLRVRSQVEQFPQTIARTVNPPLTVFYGAPSQVAIVESQVIIMESGFAPTTHRQSPQMTVKRRNRAEGKGNAPDRNSVTHRSSSRM